jgi:uncharacterized protein (DUF2141 family)
MIEMKKIIYGFGFLATIILFTSFDYQKKKINCSLTVEVSGLRNSKGVVQFALYHTPDAFPDENYKKYYLKLTDKIDDKFSTVTFENLPPGKYAINILHDEDENGKIKKGMVLPKEGIGFSNYESIGMFNKPKFSEAEIILKSDTTIQVKIIYM